MTLKLSSLKTDVTKEDDGDWIPAATMPGVSFKVRSPQFGAFKTARDLLIQKLTRRRRAGDDEYADKVDREVGKLYAEHILLDWKGLDVPYSKELAIEVCTDRGYRRTVFAAIQACADEVGISELEYIEDAAKN